ncbi:hypothetical protein HG530_014912 [Fusarium avenaceum]|nr:hypothetical protein HG530_014912 [Fusarium avenaceum]
MEEEYLFAVGFIPKIPSWLVRTIRAARSSESHIHAFNLHNRRTTCPLSLVAKAVLVDIHKALTTLLRKLSKRSSSISELLQSTWTVSIDDNICLGEKALKLSPSLGGLEVKLGSVFSHVSINLEEWYIAQVGAGNLEHIGAILAENTGDDWSSDDPTELEDFDAFEYPCWLA